MFEIEIKSLLGSKERADELRTRLFKLFPDLKTLSPHKQKNHYFTGSSQAPQGIAVDTNPSERIIRADTAHANKDSKVSSAILDAITPFLSAEKKQGLSRIILSARGEVSIRTRDADGRVLFILKASIGSDTSSNGVSRIEFEEPVPLTLAQLDQKLLDAGLAYQAKWSREREEYVEGKTHVTIDKNAGYGYLAEFERIVEDGKDAGKAKEELQSFMEQVGCEELLQDRLERMFAYYNKHWQEYYGTDKVFIVE